MAGYGIEPAAIRFARENLMGGNIDTDGDKPRMRNEFRRIVRTAAVQESMATQVRGYQQRILDLRFEIIRQDEIPRPG